MPPLAEPWPLGDIYVCGGKPSAAVMESGEGGQNWSGHRDARQGANDSPQRDGISQRTTGRVLTFVPLEERVDILPSRTMAGWRIVSSVLPLRYFSTPSTIFNG